MATFKVGQRVRIVRAIPAAQHLIGAEGVIYAIPSEWSPDEAVCSVLVDGYDPRQHGWRYPTCGCTDWSHIAPLTDPKAEEFIARIKRLEREPEPKLTEKV